MGFTVTAEHIALTQQLCFTEGESEQGTPLPYIDEKRPFGNSDVIKDVAEILDWRPVENRDGDEVISRDQTRDIMRLLEELPTVLSIICQNPGTCPIGHWVNMSSCRYSRPEWVKKAT